MTGREIPPRAPAWCSGHRSAQDAAELAALTAEAAAIGPGGRYLEIGARFGDTLVAVTRAFGGPAHATVVDLPGGAWGKRESAPVLERAVATLRDEGHDVALALEDVHNARVRAFLERRAPFDLVLIDADHSLRAVAVDVALVAPFVAPGGVLVLHDVADDAPPRVEVPLLWRALRALLPDRTSAVVTPGARMGLGFIRFPR